MLDGLTRGAEFAEIVRGYVERATAPLLARIEELEKRPTSDDVDDRIANAVRLAVAALPLPKDGADADPAVIRQMVAEAVRAIPAPRDGQDIDPETIRGMVADAVAALPKPRDGQDADPELIKTQITQAVREAVREAVAAIPAAKDGVGLAGAVIDRQGHLILTLSNGETRDLGRVDGKDGEPGRAGFALTDFEVQQIDLRTLTLSFVAGDVRQTYEVALGGFIDRGVYKDETDYELGDAATFGGQLWIAQAPTKAKPGTSDDWRLAVKKGRDGADFDPARNRKLIDDAVSAAVAAQAKKTAGGK